MSERRNDLEITNEIPQNCFCRSQTRINLLFTMSEITRVTVHPDSAREVMFRGRYSLGQQSTRLEPARLRSSSYAGHASINQDRLCHAKPKAKRGGARRDRTDDLMLAKHALSQLSYGPVTRRRMLSRRLLSCISLKRTRSKWWAWEDLNFRPHAYQARALTN